MDKYTSAYHSEVVQNISILKAVSRYLPYAQRPVQVVWSDGDRVGDKNMGVIRREDSVSYQLRNEELPPLPWKYTVLSTVPDVELSQYIRPWREPPRNFGWNYRQLPRKVISARMMDLARDLTESADTPHQKALVLRDYLRQNFTYNMSPPRPPAGQELSDFFLFESREGFCQHYAQALTLLARMAGLHSRLVTGYSPGNFNLLANCFEVYEYHGHAWVQIFIEPFGWLTFDGTPPGELRLEDTPPLLKSLLDPFGDKWKVQTPELSARSPVPPKPSLLRGQTPPQQPKKLQSGQQQSVLQQKVLEAYNEIYAKAVADNATFSPEAKHILKAAAQTLKSKVLAFGKQAMESFKALANAFAQRMLDGLKAVFDWLSARTLADLLLLALLLAAAGLAWKLRRRCWYYLLWRWRLYQCTRDWQKIATQKMAERVRIEACQKLVSELLGLIGLRRQPQRDLLEYTEIILQRLPALADDYAFIASTAAETWYSTHLPDENLADAVFVATKHFFQTIRPHLRRRNFPKAQA
ncbi:MAG: transglutaminase domain-containing protein [Oligosphaeraceae bacterium]|nr:transglutaminase domain-containing protein [Oligosphaeraceae bacterium]